MSERDYRAEAERHTEQADSFTEPHDAITRRAHRIAAAVYEQMARWCDENPPLCGCYQRPHAWDGVLYDWCQACVGRTLHGHWLQ